MPYPSDCSLPQVLMRKLLHCQVCVLSGLLNCLSFGTFQAMLPVCPSALHWLARLLVGKQLQAGDESSQRAFNHRYTLLCFMGVCALVGHVDSLFCEFVGSLTQV